MTKAQPLDLLEQSLNKTILLRLRGDKELRGVLRGYDQHLNLVLENAELMALDEGETRTIQLGKIILRGDNVMVVSPP
jgi:small nuclear ribonucleoprotein